MAGQHRLRVLAPLAVLLGMGGCHWWQMPPMRRISSDAPPEVRPQVRRLYSLDPQRRAQGCLDLAGMGEAAAPAVPCLIGLLGDRAWAWSPSRWIPYVGKQVGSEAAWALSRIGAPAMGPVVEALRSHGSAGVRAGAAGALGHTADPSVLPALIEAVKNDSSSRVRASAAAALGRFDDPRTAPALREAKKDRQARVRKSATRSLVQLERGR